MLRTIANTFLQGLFFTLPLLITFGLLYWLFYTAENLLKIPLQMILPDGWYITGLGVVFALAIIFILGVMVQAYLVKHLMSWLEGLVRKIPIVRTLYVSARDLINFFAGDKSETMQKVVAITIDGARLVGFVTNEDVDMFDDPDLIAVYLPLSYQVGGYVVYVPRDRCEELDVPVKKAMQQILTAHIKK